MRPDDVLHVLEEAPVLLRNHAATYRLFELCCGITLPRKMWSSPILYLNFQLLATFQPEKVPEIRAKTFQKRGKRACLGGIG